MTSQVVGLEFLAADRRGDLWMSLPSASALYEKQARAFDEHGLRRLDHDCDCGSPRQIQPNGIAFDASQECLWVVDAKSSGCRLTGTRRARWRRARPVPTRLTSCSLGGVLNGGTITSAQLTAVAFDASGNMWIADAATSVVYELLAGQISGSGVDVQTYGIMQVGPNANAQPHSDRFRRERQPLGVVPRQRRPLQSLRVQQYRTWATSSTTAPHRPIAVVDVSGGMNPDHVGRIRRGGQPVARAVERAARGRSGWSRKSELPTSARGPFGVRRDLRSALLLVTCRRPSPSLRRRPACQCTAFSAVWRHAPRPSRPLAAVRSAPVRRMTR